MSKTNKGFEKYLASIATLCEHWLVIYQKFLSMGLSTEDALMHTKAFTSATLGLSMNKDGDNKDDVS
jgi:hypothetical protein